MTDDDIRDLFAGLGPVTVKRMFGGKSVYHHGVIIALEVGGDILLKADGESAELFREAGSTQWIYESGKPGAVKGPKRRGPVAMPYWSIPDVALDDPDEMALWSRRAYEAGLRAEKAKPG